MSLPEYIEFIGDAKASVAFGVPARTVQSWRRRERVPRPAKAAEIVSIAGGALTMESIYRQPDAAAEAA